MHTRGRTNGCGACVVVILDEHYSNCFVQGRKTIRRIIDSDVNYQQILSSEVLSLNIGTGEQGPGSNGAVRVRKTVHTAKIFQCQDIFTTTTLEAVDADDRDRVRKVSIHVRMKLKILMVSCR